MRLFVAGGTGAVGRQMIPRLLAAGHTVTAISRQPERAERLRAAGAEAAVCDVFDRGRLIDLVRRATPDAIIHQLTDLPSTMEPRKLAAIYERNNRVRREGTANLIEAARGAGVARMIVQSMATWYRPEGSPIKVESDPLWTEAPEPLGAAVRTVEEMEQAVLKAIPVAVVLRYGAFYGAGTWYAADGEVAARVRRRGLPIVGDGTGMTSFVHIEDAAGAVLPALATASSGIFNIVDDEPAAAADWLPVYAQALGAPPPRRVPVFLARLVLGKALTAWVTTMRGASNGAAATKLGWRPEHRTWRKAFEESKKEERRSKK